MTEETITKKETEDALEAAIDVTAAIYFVIGQAHILDKLAKIGFDISSIQIDSLSEDETNNKNIDDIIAEYENGEK